MSDSGVSAVTASVEIQGARIDLITRGAGTPILFLHPELGNVFDHPVLDQLARRGKVYGPSHPGFGTSDLPAWMNSVDDLAYFYLDFLDTQALEDVIVVGASLGGWIAAEMSVRSTGRISHLVLAGAAGIKVSDREHRDFADYFALSQADLDALNFNDAKFAMDYKSMSDEALTIAFRNRESTGLFAWSPWMHNPKLLRRLHRIDVPTLVLWGANDRVVSPDYGRAYAAAIARATIDIISPSGHYPHIEQPAAFAQAVFSFVDAIKR